MAGVGIIIIIIGIIAPTALAYALARYLAWLEFRHAVQRRLGEIGKSAAARETGVGAASEQRPSTSRTVALHSGRGITP